ncbi:MAG TPA: hypothetical protein VII58_05025 [Acidobacteriaceae bacterium]
MGVAPGTDYSAIIAGLQAKVDELRLKRASINAEIEAVEQGIATFSSLSRGTVLPSVESRLHMSVQKDRTTTISPRSPKSPTYGSFAGRYTIAPPCPTQPDHGMRPSGSGEDWVSIIASNASPFALCLAVLRAHRGDTITSPELNSRVAEIRKIAGGAAYATLDSLVEAGAIEGNHTRWVIKDRNRGGIIAGRYLWCDPETLNIYDWAAVRREAIAILLTESPNVTNAAITKSLEKCEWLKSPVTPHLVKADLRRFEIKGWAVQNETDKTWKLNDKAKESNWF